MMYSSQSSGNFTMFENGEYENNLTCNSSKFGIPIWIGYQT